MQVARASRLCATRSRIPQKDEANQSMNRRGSKTRVKGKAEGGQEN
jgi:hypothetical protein